jgi:hypothetical protein
MYARNENTWKVMIVQAEEVIADPRETEHKTWCLATAVHSATPRAQAVAVMKQGFARGIFSDNLHTWNAKAASREHERCCTSKESVTKRVVQRVRLR